MYSLIIDHNDYDKGDEDILYQNQYQGFFNICRKIKKKILLIVVRETSKNSFCE